MDQFRGNFEFLSYIYFANQYFIHKLCILFWANCVISSSGMLRYTYHFSLAYAKIQQKSESKLLNIKLLGIFFSEINIFLIVWNNTQPLKSHHRNYHSSDLFLCLKLPRIQVSQTIFSENMNISVVRHFTCNIIFLSILLDCSRRVSKIARKRKFLVLALFLVG